MLPYLLGQRIPLFLPLLIPPCIVDLGEQIDANIHDVDSQKKLVAAAV